MWGGKSQHESRRVDMLPGRVGKNQIFIQKIKKSFDFYIFALYTLKMLSVIIEVIIEYWRYQWLNFTLILFLLSDCGVFLLQYIEAFFDDTDTAKYGSRRSYRNAFDSSGGDATENTSANTSIFCFWWRNNRSGLVMSGLPSSLIGPIFLDPMIGCDQDGCEDCDRSDCE